tara:strand:- start:11647 stop:12552 length:906 start_codon:yes stop_codon:yes gene_type:complete
MVNNNESMNCKICGKKGFLYFEKEYSNEELKNFFKNFYGNVYLDNINEYLKNQNYTLLKCSECSFIWQKFVPDEKFSNFLYEEIINKNFSLNKSINFEKISRKKNKYKFKAILDHFNKEKINILDFGAGWGSWLINLDKNKVNKFAYEISPSRKSYLTSNGIDVLNDDQILNYKNYFDYIRLEQVLEHIPDINKSMKLIKLISKKGCILEIGVPNGIKQIKNVASLEIVKGPIQPLEHLNCFTNKSLKKFIKMYNFEALKMINILNLYSYRSFGGVFNMKILIKEILDNTFSTSVKFRLKE